MRRRQMRDEQDLLNRRKHAMLNQLTSLSALAVETAENLPDVPEMSDSEFADVVGFRADDQGSSDAEIESDPTIGSATDEAEEPAEPAPVAGHQHGAVQGQPPADPGQPRGPLAVRRPRDHVDDLQPRPAHSS